MKAIIFSGGSAHPLPPNLIQPNDYIIAADGGYVFAKKNKITPNITIGDFDSLEEHKIKGKTLKLSPKKDDTDTLSAAKYALKMDCDEVIIVGALGGRFDHAFANLQTLLHIKNAGAKAQIIAKDLRITLIKDEKIKIAKEFRYLSIYAVGGQAEGVTLKGVKYSLDNATLTPDFPVGTSNEIIEKSAEIEVKNGNLLIIEQD